MPLYLCLIIMLLTMNILKRIKIGRQKNSLTMFLIILYLCIIQFSVSESKLLFGYFGLFLLALYLDVFDKNDKAEIFNGIIDGILVGFVVTQSFCYLFRHYQIDSVRYLSYHIGTTAAGLMYLLVYLASIIRYYQMIISKEKNGRNRDIGFYQYLYFQIYI